MLEALGRLPSGARLERMRRSPLFRDGHFHNTHPVPTGLDPAVKFPLWEMLRGGSERKPPAPLPASDPRAAWATAPGSGLRATWLGHSTTLLEIDGLRILTDPVWGHRCSPLKHLGPARFQPVPVAIAQLPDVDAIVVSHDHYDHLDWPTMQAFAAARMPIIVPLGVGEHLESWGIASSRIRELDWWEETTIRPMAGGSAEDRHGPGTAPAGDRKLVVTSTPSQHFSGRKFNTRHTTLWTSYVLAGARHKVFFSGDTGLTDEFEQVRQRLGPLDLTMLEVGAHHPSWGHIHLGPENAMKAFRMLGGGTLLPIHWGTFNLALHAWDAPPEALVARQDALGGKLMLPRLGQPVEPSLAGPVEPWWRELRKAGQAAPGRTPAPRASQG